MSSSLVRLSAILGCALLLGSGIAQIPFDNAERDRARGMLRDVAGAIRKYYYDPNGHGVDMAARFRTAEGLIHQATTFGQAYAAIANAVDALDDPHTSFQPPTPPVRREFGYEWQFVGDQCFVTAVRSNSSASGRLVPGDQLISLEGFTLTRENQWKAIYAINQLYENPAVHLTIRRAGGNPTQVEITPKVKPSHNIFYPAAAFPIDNMVEIRGDDSNEVVLRQEHWESGGAMIWKMNGFGPTSGVIAQLVRDTRKHQALILDLRGNRGGLEKTLQFLVSSVIDHPVVIATPKSRNPEFKPLAAKPRGSSVFRGKLIVLIDSRSAQEAELFARVVQLEHRGTVVGDRSAGSVMKALYYPFSQGLATKIFYGVSITVADAIMADGTSLEHTGVIPDEIVLPTPADLAAGTDPALSRAAHLAGIELDPSQAGKIFPIEWRAAVLPALSPARVPPDKLQRASSEPSRAKPVPISPSSSRLIWFPQSFGRPRRMAGPAAPHE